MNEQRKAKFSLGSKVKLNVGGPEMVVYMINEHRSGEFTGTYRCQWFAGKKLENGPFAEESLVEVIEVDVKSNES